MRIAIPGGTGQVGTLLARSFHSEGHDVVALARTPRPAPWRVVEWDLSNPAGWARELDGADVVINLAGRSVNCRYTQANRREIIESRVDSVRAVGQAIAVAKRPPRVWLQASTATIYAHTYGPSWDESGAIGGGDGAPDAWRFSIDVVRAWEKALDDAPSGGARKLKLRSALILNADPGSIFGTLLALVRRGLGGTAGSGRQYMSWIHETDFIRAVRFLIARDTIDDVVNVAAPNPLPNKEFMRILREEWGTAIGLPASEWMLAIGAFFMRTETELVLKSRRVVPGRLLREGFAFEYPDWPSAARELCSRGRRLLKSYPF